MDSNGTRFHMLLGEDDWSRCRTPDGTPAFDSLEQVTWTPQRREVTLWEEAFRFAHAKSERPVRPEDRRGAARDAFGNWYWIAPDERSILVAAEDSATASPYWPVPVADAEACPRGSGAFRPTEVSAREPVVLRGLAVTEDHYLVAGTVEPRGVLIFDLYSVGAPRQRIWPVAFEPFDLAPRLGGGVWILDRRRRSLWELDRRFEIVAASPAAAPADSGDGGFAAEDGTQGADAVVRPPIGPQAGAAVGSDASDVIAVEPLPGGGVLVLERGEASGFAIVHLIEGGVERGTPVSTEHMTEHVSPGDEPFRLVGHDFALVARGDDDPSRWIGRLLVVGTEGNQAFAFGVTRQGDRLGLEPLAECFPMRLFGGRALAAAAGEPWYDCDVRWVPLVRQKRRRHVERAEIWTPVFDGGIPDCVWHRLMLDACIPSATEVEVYSRAADDWRELTSPDRLSVRERRALGAIDVASPGDDAAPVAPAEWRREPSPYLRGDGCELPYLPREEGPGRGTWELLFQRARGRYLQVRLVLIGDGRSTPRLRALRVWYPRFSYLERYLPAVYRDDAESASFLDRFLANVEGTFTAIEDRVASAQMLFDVASAPPEVVDWLGRWFGVALDPSWEDHRKRLFLRHAPDFFAVRGTVRGLQLALRLALDECVDEQLFADPGRAARNAAPIRIIEKFRARRTPPALLGDVGTAVPGAPRFDSTARWRPSAGAAELHCRYREALGAAAPAEFPLVAADSTAPSRWADFAARELGFVPQAGAVERANWRTFLERRYTKRHGAGALAAVNGSHGVALTSFDDVGLPARDPVRAAHTADWRDFLATTAGRERVLWQAFLARRYRSAAAFSAAWKTSWSSFADVALPDRLPAEVAALADWFQFEGTVLAMHASAHQFRAMVPVVRRKRTDTPAQQRRLALARRVLDLEKPAHTTFDMRFYWAMFRLGEARLGDDTLIDLGSRSPELMAPMTLGQGSLSESFLAPPCGRDADDRLRIGRDRVGCSTRLGGP